MQTSYNSSKIKVITSLYLLLSVYLFPLVLSKGFHSLLIAPNRYFSLNLWRMKNHLRSDPKDEFWLTTCFVCGNKAKDGEKHIRNYGGVVCFSCRQFFRRAHQKSTAPKFNCKNDGDCNMSDVTQVGTFCTLCKNGGR